MGNSARQMTWFLQQSAEKEREETYKLRGLKENQSITVCRAWVLLKNKKQTNKN